MRIPARFAPSGLGLLVLLGALCATGRAEPGRAGDWGLARRLYADPKARQVGDILTVVIDERSETAKDAESSSSKQSAIGGEISVSHPRLDAQPTDWTNAVVPAWALSTSRSFEGAGSSENKDTFVTTISVTVLDVLPNGNLVVEGSRHVSVRDDRVTITLSGIVRPRDISRGNSVPSSRVADAIVRYETSGTLARNQEKGLVTRLWDWINPF